MRVSAVEGHRIWAPHYDREINPLVALESRILPDLLFPVAFECVLDIGCGTGRWMNYFQRRGARVFGADLCLEMLHQAEQKPALLGRSALAEASAIPFKSGISGTTLCSFAAAYFSDLNRCIQEMARVTARGGTVVISDLHPAGMAAGWTRSFRLGNSVFEMNHFAPSVEGMLAAAESARLHLHIQVDACFGEQERLLFRAAGKENLYRRILGTPAIWIAVWKKR